MSRLHAIERWTSFTLRRLVMTTGPGPRLRFVAQVTRPDGRRPCVKDVRRHVATAKCISSAGRWARRLTRFWLNAATPYFRACGVEGVEPFPDASRLLVTVAFIDNRPGKWPTSALVVDHLQRASGHLRDREVATAVTPQAATSLLLYRLAEPPRTSMRSRRALAIVALKYP